MGIIDPGDAEQILCPRIDWSAAESASAYSQLAGVLAGFAFSGLVLLLSQRGSGTLRARAMSMLITAFVLLSMDSFNFGFITGNGQSVSGATVAEVCSRTWTQFMFAGGMLGVGGIAVVSAAGWLLAAHVEADRLARAGRGTDDPGNGPCPGPADFTGVQRLARAATYCVAGVTVLLLFMTARGYLDVMYGLTSRSTPAWILVPYPIAILSGVVLLRVRARTRPPRPAPSPGGVLRSSDRVFTVGVYGAIAYATTGTAVVGLAMDLPMGLWRSAPEELAIVTAAFSLLLPAPTLIALVHTTPRFQSGAPGEGERPGPRPPEAGRPGAAGPSAPPPPPPSAVPAPVPPPAPAPPPTPPALPVPSPSRPRKAAGRKRARPGKPAKPA
ncbi:hypothetical protein [Streptosporangium sp. NPDC023615]|uniref:hypothetical protein n=1 Tax=Streptosporangium sp. NPDC023615 TaxID=3154794 RepID=UPI0034328C4C